ncbi:MAG: hypothetical protein JWO62_1214 [Acidimicrobiaceae bacterium]|nr:hypothetical protein [Acidimicrobiaceae bacterium]
MTDERRGPSRSQAPSTRPRPPLRRRTSPTGDQSLSSALDAYLRSQGHEGAYLLGAVCGCWSEVVGAEVAAHVTPLALRGDDLVVAVDHAGWVTQLPFLAGQILTQLEERVGQHVAARLKVTVRGRPGIE